MDSAPRGRAEAAGGSDDTFVALVRAALGASAGEDLQSMVELVAGLTEAPMAALGFLHDGTYFYDVTTGLPPFASVGGTTLCQFASGSRGIVEVPDTLADERTRHLPSVDGREHAVRYYVSAPVLVEGREVGRFCVFDTRPRRLGGAEVSTLRVLSEAVGTILERRLIGAESSGHPAGLRTPRSGDDLVARAAHDLRSPLVTLAASLELLHDAIEPADGSMPAMLIEKAEGAVLRLHELVGGVLALHGLERSFVPVEVDLDDLLGSVLTDLDVQLRAGGGEVRSSTLGTAYGDPAQLYSVLLNLIGNALKFARPGRTPTVAVRTRPEHGGVLLTVADDGIGIPAEKRGDVLELFTTLGGAAGGHGIGLNTVARVVEVHGGRVTLDAGAGGEGTEVRIWLPGP